MDGKPVVLKILSDTSASPEAVARFRREFDLIAGLNGGANPEERVEGVIGALACETDAGNPVIILEDFGGESLDIQRRIWPLDDFFNLALQVVETLGRIHGLQVIHKDINPSNIVRNPATGELKIIDFGLSTCLPRETVARASVNVLEGTLAYISPEQTGRINRAVDYRTDFYSLGVTFYELLTGRLPFEDREPLGLIHSHLARQPVPPHEINGAIPVPISNILMKLLAKNAEERYQSAHGLKSDLLECERQWHAKRVIQDFPLAANDLSDRYPISQVLFGRQKELDILLEAFVNTRNGACELLLILGMSGMGKSSLVNELQIPVAEQDGIFVSGRYVQAQSQAPYSGLIEALRLLIQGLLAENEETEYVAYVSEQNLLIDEAGTPVRHPQVREYFEGYDPKNKAYRLRLRTAH